MGNSEISRTALIWKGTFRTKWMFCALIGAACLCLPGAAAEDISSIDKNFQPAMVGNRKVHYYNALKKPFEVTGFAWWKEGEPLYRIPKELTEKEVNKGVLELANHTSGGTIRFKTDSPFLTIRIKYIWKGFSDMNHMPRSGSGGVDLYTTDENGREKYLGSAQPSRGGKPLERFLAHMPGGKMRNYTVYLPLYSGVSSLELGIRPGSRILPPDPQKIKKPILFYGSSITMGGCASRPANNYTTMLCRAVDAPQINLGFSGSAKGEPALARAIAELDLAAFVLDYDYNAPSVQHLKDTHEAFFLTIRKARPELPVIILSQCSHISKARRDVIRKTYENAVARGDRKVWFIDGSELFGEAGDAMCTVDNCHPNDLGFYMMYKRVLPVLRQALNL